MTISLAITTYNRFAMTVESFELVRDDHRISEIIISDDTSTDGATEKLYNYFRDDKKVQVWEANKNLGVYHNKKLAIELCHNDYVIILDSDNIIDKSYLDCLYSVPWGSDLIFAPEFARPQLDYRRYSGLTITKENVKYYADKPHFSSLLNTANYFVNRSEYLRVWEDGIEPIGSDSIHQNYNWLKAGNRIHVMRGLQYEHRVHPMSHYVNNAAASEPLCRNVLQQIKQLR